MGQSDFARPFDDCNLSTMVIERYVKLISVIEVCIIFEILHINESTVGNSCINCSIVHTILGQKTDKKETKYLFIG